MPNCLDAAGLAASKNFRSFWVASLAGGIMAIASCSVAGADANSALPSVVGAFKMVHSTGSPQTYTPATLENHIDGEAQSVKEYDFRKTAYAEYAPNGQGNQLITVDIFQFGSSDDAYGYYSGQRSHTARLEKIGAEGYQEATALNFWKGPYYVRIALTAQHPTPAFTQEMPKLAQSIASKLTGSTAAPAVIGALPGGYTPRTERFQRSNVAAQSFFMNGASARYPSAGQSAELFLMSFSSASAAKAAFAKYQAYVTSPNNLAVGAKPTMTKGLGESGLSVRTKFTGLIVAGEKGKFISIVRKAKDESKAVSLVKSALAKAR